ncbi:MAG: nucleotidyltransferase family protein [Thalassotalea sp.]|nr:nucleotidyltransferase family protein [Thalassotalea sp.]
MSAVTEHVKQEKITEQTFYDLGMWLTHPNDHNLKQLVTLKDEDARLPLIKLVNQYWLGGALYNSLKASNVWQELDEELKAYLIELNDFYQQRSEGIKQEAIFACDLLTDAQIPVVMLKGGASLFNGVFNPISSRFMTDVDLLVPEDKQQIANEILTAAGYAPKEDEHATPMAGHHHAPALFRKQGGHCCVELHRWVLKKSVSDVLSTDEVWAKAIPLKLSDTLQVLQMEPNQQVVLSVAHSELSHKGYEEQHIDWRQLLNLYALILHYSNTLNWQVISEHFNRCNKPESLNALLLACAIFFKQTNALTDTDDEMSQQHIANCMAKYENRQGTYKPFAHLFAVLRGYKKESISTAYGEKGLFSISIGRLRHFKRHITMLLNPETLKRFLRRL